MRLLKVKESLINLNSSNRLYQVSIPIIAITGGIATGKTTVANKLQSLGAPLINADFLVKNIYQTEEALEFVRHLFPSAVLDNKILFPILRQAVFSNPDLKQKIENFIYPRMEDQFLAAIPSSANYIVYDVPLLFERSMQSLVDCNFLVYSPRAVQLTRLMQRDHISMDLAQKILDSQMDIEQKKAQAQFVLDNSTDMDQLDVNFQSIIQQIWVLS